MRNRRLNRLEQRWARPDLFVQRRRRPPWRWILLALVLGLLAYGLPRMDLGVLWGSIQSGLPAPAETSQPKSEPNRLPLPLPDPG